MMKTGLVDKFDVMILGAGGMLGSDIVSLTEEAGYSCCALDVPAVDITDKRSLAMLPDAACIINCAAFTDVDGCEDNPDIAFKVNAVGAGNVAKHCHDTGTFLVHISTDYVFDGEITRAYNESDNVSPINTYGKSKAEGERLVAEACEKSLIVRTQSLFGLNGRNFVFAIIDKINNGAVSLRVVCDQVSSPTNTRHLGSALLELVRLRQTGLVHVASSGCCSWHEFSEAIVDGIGSTAEVEAVESSQYPRKARRPAYSVLDNSFYRELTGGTMPDWRQGLNIFLEALSHQNKGR